MGSQARQRGAHQPRDAPLRDPAPPRALGDVLGPPALRRGRRAPRLPRSLRKPRGAPPATTAATRQPPRCRPDLHRFLGDHRRPGQAGRQPLGQRGRRCHRRWRTALDRGRWRCGSPRSSTVRRDGVCRLTPKPRASSLLWSAPGTPRWASAGAGAAPRWWPPMCAAGCHGGSLLVCAPTAAATWSMSGVRSRMISSLAALQGWSPPPRWSWASTSVDSTPWCSTGSLARSRPSGSRQVAPDVHSSRRPPCWLRAPTSSTSGWPPTPTSCSTGRPKPAVVNPANPHVLDPHLRCAAHELALSHDDQRWWPGLLDDGVRRLALADDVSVRRRGRRREPLAFWAGSGWPAHGIGLRSATGRPVRIVDQEQRPVGDVDRGRAPEQVHPGATYLHQGRHWRVTSLDIDAGVAEVEPHDGATYTVARTDTDLRLSDRRRTAIDGLRHGPPGSRNRAHAGDRLPGEGRADERGRQRNTDSISLLRHSRLVPCGGCFSDDLLLAAAVGRVEAPGALHAVEHAAIGMLPLFAICDRWDVGGVSTARHLDTGQPTIVIYDATPGGAGIAELGFDACDRLLQTTLGTIELCSCTAGCPSCVQSPKCGNGNEPLDKHAAIRLLRALLSMIRHSRRACADERILISGSTGPMRATSVGER